MMQENVLVVDDHPEIRDLMVKILERRGYRVSTASDGHDALTQFALARPDLVITDLFMPEKDGVEVVRTLIKHDPDVKIFAMSGGDSAGGRKDVLEVLEDFGVKKTFGKPFKIAEVLAAAKDILSSE